MKTIPTEWQPLALTSLDALANAATAAHDKASSLGQSTAAHAEESPAGLNALEFADDFQAAAWPGTAFPARPTESAPSGRAESPQLIWLDLGFREHSPGPQQTLSARYQEESTEPRATTLAPSPTRDATRLQARLAQVLREQSVDRASKDGSPATTAHSTDPADSDYVPSARDDKPSRLRKRTSAPARTPLHEKSGSSVALPALDSNPASIPANPWIRPGKAISKAFRRATLQRVEETGQQNAVAREVGINERTLRRWIQAERRASEDRFPRTYSKRAASSQPAPEASTRTTRKRLR